MHKDEKQIHFIGIGGIGMSALAHILADKGINVSGSDISSSYVLDGLKKKGVKIAIGHSEENVHGATTVVYSTDVAMQNPECKEALRQGIRLIHRSHLLAEMLNGQTSLLVAGTHGKTTTSSLLAHVLHEAGFQPSFAIGGIVSSLGTNGAGGKGPFFVAEADESDGSFLKYMPFGAIITNVDNDHMEYWKSDDELLKAFKQFADQVTSKENLFWCKDDDLLNSLKLDGYSYGFSEEADLWIQNYSQKGWVNLFDFTFQGVSYQEVEIPLVGAHNVLNAAAVFGTALQIGIPEEALRSAFKSFRGVGRRAEKKGEAAGITFYDDYAHHPTEIIATLRAMKAAVGSKRLVAVFQPHRYTRVRDCMEQFPQVFDAADVVVVTDIFSAREEPIPHITAETLFKKIQHKSAAEVLFASRSELTDFLFHFLKPEDVLVTMGAGDVTKIGPEILARL